MFSKWKSRLNATRFEFMVHVHTLQPWPTGSKAVAIGWQRGKRRRGATNSVLPLPNKEGLGTVVRFNEKFSLTSTLYKVRALELRRCCPWCRRRADATPTCGSLHCACPACQPGGGTSPTWWWLHWVSILRRPTPAAQQPQAPGAPERSSSHVGPFKKKCLILAVLETDGRTHATAALGRIVIDLSEFASLDSQELRTFTVACNKSIHAAVGEPNLTVTIRCARVRGQGGGRQLQPQVGRHSAPAAGRMPLSLVLQQVPLEEGWC
jgi:hypothetical protein